MNSTVFLPPTKKYPNPRMWDLNYIWRSSSDLYVSSISVDMLWNEMYSNIYVWLDKNEEITNNHFLHHFERVLDADMNYPIILSEENYILDGVHRLVKAKHLGWETIACKKFLVDPTPIS